MVINRIPIRKIKPLLLMLRDIVFGGGIRIVKVTISVLVTDTVTCVGY